MTYTGLQEVLDRCWSEFLSRFESETGVSSRTLEKELDRKDAFNKVVDCVMNVVDLEYEDE